MVSARPTAAVEREGDCVGGRRPELHPQCLQAPVVGGAAPNLLTTTARSADKLGLAGRDCTGAPVPVAAAGGLCRPRGSRRGCGRPGGKGSRNALPAGRRAGLDRLKRARRPDQPTGKPRGGVGAQRRGHTKTFKPKAVQPKFQERSATSQIERQLGSRLALRQFVHHCFVRARLALKPAGPAPGCRAVPAHPRPAGRRCGRNPRTQYSPQVRPVSV